MTDIQTKAILLLQGSPARKGIPINYDISRAHAIEAICRAIEAHEAFRQEVSDAVEAYFTLENYLGKFNDTLGRFIIPKPKPDPLVEIIGEINDGPYIETKAEYADRIRAALDAAGFEIKEKSK